jgi:uncharacterized protein (TIGR02118 family)
LEPAAIEIVSAADQSPAVGLTDSRSRLISAGFTCDHRWRENMIKVTVFYPNTAGSTFDMPYYLDKHMPMVRQKLGSALKGASVEQGLGGGEPGSPPPYLAMGAPRLRIGRSVPTRLGTHAEAIVGDVPNYTNTQPAIQVSDVKL